MKFLSPDNAFVHIPRTAGEYIVRHLPNVNRVSNKLTPYRISFFQDTVWKEQFDYSFAFVRHPLERALSAWFYMNEFAKDLAGCMTHTQRGRYDLEEMEWVNYHCQDLLEFSEKLESICSDPTLSYHFLPQHWWIGKKGCRVHQVWKYENLERNVHYVSEKTPSMWVREEADWNPRSFLRSGSWSSKDYVKILQDNPEVVANLTKFYADDFDFGYPPLPQDRVKREYLVPCQKMGIVVGTYGTPPYVELQLNSLRKFMPNCPILVVDDHSDHWEEIEQLCRRYCVDFLVNSENLNHWRGDLNVFAQGLLWAKRNQVDLLLKLSRRHILLEPIQNELLQIANNNPQLGISFYHEAKAIWTTSSFTCLKVKPWLLTVPKIQSKIAKLDSFEIFYVERYLGALGSWLHHQVYNKKAAYPFFHWGDLFRKTAFKFRFQEHYELSQELGLEYALSDFDPENSSEMYQYYYEAHKDLEFNNQSCVL